MLALCFPCHYTCRLPRIELLSNEGNSEKDTATKSTKPGTHEATATAAPSVEDSAVSLECLHVSDTKPDKGIVDSNSKQLNSEVTVKTNDNTNVTPKLETAIDTSISSTSKCDSSDIPSDAKLQFSGHHQTDQTTSNNGPKVNVGPKHYGAPVQKLPPREKVMSALLQWKTPETIKFLAGALPDYSKVGDDSEVRKQHITSPC